MISRLEVHISNIAKEFSELKQSITSSENRVNKKLEEMQARVNKQANIIAQQQLFLEGVDPKQRETIIVTGLPDEHKALDGATNDDDKIQKIWEVIGARTVVRSHRRLGRLNPNPDRHRPLLVVIESKIERDAVLEKTSKMKERGEPYSKIYIKKDVHPSVRQEWRRSRTSEQNERNRPENQGCVIRLDNKERKLYKDGIVIDMWNPQPF